MDDLISRQAVLEIQAKYAEHMGATKFWQMRDDIKTLSPVKPQESCDVPDTNVGDIINKQTVLDTISELNAISFYEAQEDSKECYYELRQAIKDLSPVKQEPKTGHWIDIMVGDMPAQVCDRCNTFYPLAYTGGGHKFCPHCGAMMVEPQESEDKV